MRTLSGVNSFRKIIIPKNNNSKRTFFFYGVIDHAENCIGDKNKPSQFVHEMSQRLESEDIDLFVQGTKISDDEERGGSGGFKGFGDDFISGGPNRKHFYKQILNENKKGRLHFTGVDKLGILDDHKPFIDPLLDFYIEKYKKNKNMEERKTASEVIEQICWTPYKKIIDGGVEFEKLKKQFSSSEDDFEALFGMIKKEYEKHENQPWLKKGEDPRRFMRRLCALYTFGRMVFKTTANEVYLYAEQWLIDMVVGFFRQYKNISIPLQQQDTRNRNCTSLSASLSFNDANDKHSEISGANYFRKVVRDQKQIYLIGEYHVGLAGCPSDTSVPSAISNKIINILNDKMGLLDVYVECPKQGFISSSENFKPICKNDNNEWLNLNFVDIRDEYNGSHYVFGSTLQEALTDRYSSILDKKESITADDFTELLAIFRFVVLMSFLWTARNLKSTSVGRKILKEFNYNKTQNVMVDADSDLNHKVLEIQSDLNKVLEIQSEYAEEQSSTLLSFVWWIRTLHERKKIDFSNHFDLKMAEKIMGPPLHQNDIMDFNTIGKMLRSEKRFHVLYAGTDHARDIGDLLVEEFGFTNVFTRHSDKKENCIRETEESKLREELRVEKLKIEDEKLKIEDFFKEWNEREKQQRIENETKQQKQGRRKRTKRSHDATKRSHDLFSDDVFSNQGSFNPWQNQHNVEDDNYMKTN